MMKKYISGILSLALLCGGCGTSKMAKGDVEATIAGASIGGTLGNAIGGLIGENQRGWRGGYRGSAIGTIVGTLTGAAVGHAISTQQNQPSYNNEENIYKIQRNDNCNTTDRITSAMNGLHIHNIRFIDESRDHIIQSKESCKIIFEIMNEGIETTYRIIPVVNEVMGVKHIYISPSVMIEEIASHNGVKYTATIKAGKRIKGEEVLFHIAVADEYGKEYDWQEFSLPIEQ